MKKIALILAVCGLLIGAVAFSHSTPFPVKGETALEASGPTGKGVLFPNGVEFADGSTQTSAAHSDFTEYCLELHLTDDETGLNTVDFKGLLKIALTRTGGDYFTVQGIIPETGDNDRPVIFSGSAVKFGEELFVSFSFTQEHGDSTWHDTAVGQMRLDAQTMNGNFWDIRNDFETSKPEFDLAYDGGTIKRIDCP